MLETDAIRPFLDERHVALAARVDAYAGQEIAPRPKAADDDAARREARALVKRLGSDGWFRVIGEQDFRGCCLVREALAAASPLADAVFALQALGTVPILLAGDEAQRARWLKPALDGTAMAAFAMTEPEAGSDVAAIATIAARNGEDGGYRLNGTKTFISNAGLADLYTVFATTDPSQGRKGITCFVIPKDTEGLRFARAQVLSAPHPLGEIEFDDCRVPVEARVGGDGGGFTLGLATLDRLRPTVAAAACGMARRAMDEATAHAVTRRQFGQRLADFQLIKLKLSRMATDLTAARLLTYRAAAMCDRQEAGGRVTQAAAMAKAFATEAAQRIVDDAVQILGGRGVLADHPVDALYRSVRALRIYEGATDIQHLIIAGQVIKEASR